MTEQELRDQLTSNYGQRKAQIYLARKQMEQQLKRDQMIDRLLSVFVLAMLCVVTYGVLSL
jgi:hypothetical protein